MGAPVDDNGGHRIGAGGLCVHCGQPYPCWGARVFAMVGQRRRVRVERDTTDDGGKPDV